MNTHQENIMFKDFNDFKQHAVSYKKGTVVPEHIMLIYYEMPNGDLIRFSRPKKLVFGVDVFVVSTHGINLIIPDPASADEGYSVIRMTYRGHNRLHLIGNPNGEYGNLFIGWGNGIDPIEEANKAIAEIKAQTYKKAAQVSVKPGDSIPCLDRMSQGKNVRTVFDHYQPGI